MILTDDLIGLMAKHRISKKEMAKKLNITPKTFSLKMKRGRFGSDEIEVMIDALNIKDPVAIFLPKKYLKKLLASTPPDSRRA